MSRQPRSVRTVMRPFGELASWDRACEVAATLATPIGRSASCMLREAADRVAAADVSSPVDVPAGDRAAMDGYAVRSADVAGATSGEPVRLNRRGAVMAGRRPGPPVGAGECVEIATGAPLPGGADAVVPVEHTDRDGEVVAVSVPSARGEHVALQGEDLREGEIVVAAGARLTPARLSALASVGIQRIEVIDPPQVLVVPTGDELVPLGEPLPPGHVYESNSIAVAALLRGAGARVERNPVVGDDPKSLVAALERPGVDLVVTLGGTSVGRHDLVLDVVERLGEVIVHGVAVKPGKPLLLARVGERPVVGLPGFPTSSLMLAYGIVEPLVRCMGGRRDRRASQPAILAEDVESPADKHQLLTVALEGDRAVPAYRASSTITSISTADGWVEIPAGVDRVEAGTEVEVKLL